MGNYCIIMGNYWIIKGYSKKTGKWVEVKTTNSSHASQVKQDLKVKGLTIVAHTVIYS